MPEKAQIECSEHQDDPDIHHQSFQESASEEQEIDTDDDGYHCRCVQNDSHLSAHFNPLVQCKNEFLD